MILKITNSDTKPLDMLMTVVDLYSLRNPKSSGMLDEGSYVGLEIVFKSRVYPMDSPFLKDLDLSDPDVIEDVLIKFGSKKGSYTEYEEKDDVYFYVDESKNWKILLEDGKFSDLDVYEYISMKTNVKNHRDKYMVVMDNDNGISFLVDLDSIEINIRADLMANGENAGKYNVEGGEDAKNIVFTGVISVC